VARRSTNQRLTTVAPSTDVIDPVPSPTITPQIRTSCQAAVITVVSMMPPEITSSAVMATRRTPKRCISDAANGDIKP